MSGGRPPPLVPRAERHSVNAEFSSVDEFIHEYVTNVSRSGAFIRSRDPLPIGTKVNLRFTVLMDEIETIEGIGEVVRVSRNPSGMGVVFTELNDASQKLLTRIVTRPPGAGRPPPKKGPPPLPPSSRATKRPAGS